MLKLVNKFKAVVADKQKIGKSIGETEMAKYKEMPCKYYVALGECKKGREACHKTYCQHCNKYEARAKVRSINKKRLYNEKQKSGYGA